MLRSYKLTLVWSNLIVLITLMVGAHGHQNQYFHYAPYNLVWPNTSPACHGSLPCYNILLTLVADGPVVSDELTTARPLLDHFAIFSYDHYALVTAGRQAVHFFKEKYGFDFTYLSNDALLTGASTNDIGIKFRPFAFDPIWGFRLYTGSNNDRSQVFNWPVSLVGWRLDFMNDTQANGRSSVLIPSMGSVVYASYAIVPCLASIDCENILNPWNPRAPIVLKAETVNYHIGVLQPDPFLHLDLEFEHPVWGIGLGQGTLVRRNRASNVASLRLVITFPSRK